jgi:hypothetical protein
MASEDSPNLVAKIAGSTFALILAPLIVGIAINYSQKFLDGPKPDAEKETEKAAGPPAAKSGDAKPVEVASNTPDRATRPGRKKAIAARPKAVAPIALFNGTDLTGFHVVTLPPLRGTQAAAKGKSRTLTKAAEHAFAVQSQALHATGEVHAALVTDEAYDNYRLHLRYRWGEKTYYTAEGHPRSAAIMVHCTAVSTEGGLVQRLESVRCHLSSSGWSGDLNLLDPENKGLSMSATASDRAPGESKKAHQNLVYRADAPRTTVTTATIHRFGGDHTSLNADGSPQVANWERTIGRWNTLELVCVGDAIRVILNGKVINHVTKLGLKKGQIALATEGAEISFDDIRLVPTKTIEE